MIFALLTIFTIVFFILAIFFFIKLKKKKEENKILEVKLREFMDVANKSNSIKSVFLANMSHEIRTPLNAVLGFLELSLEDSSLTEKLYHYLFIARNSAKDLLRIINEILDVSKLEAGKVEVIKENFFLPRLIDGVYENFKPIADDKGLKLEIDIPTNLHKCIYTDPYKLKQILINIIDNSIKFTDKGIVKIDLIEEPYFIKFVIRDTGIGIAEDKIEHVFDEFIQADQSYTRLYGGIGLGSSISKHYIKLLGGGVKLSSDLGKGTKFIFTIPKEFCDCKDTNCVECFEKEYKDGIYNILLAERFKGSADLVKIRLEEKGHRVSIVNNGLEVLDKLKGSTYDILLLDVHLPVLNGIETIKEIRSKDFKGQRDIPTIGLTASVIDNIRLDCINAGINRVISKPIDFDDLTKVINVLLSEKGKLIGDEISIKEFEGLDLKRGIKNWQNETQYFNALEEFSLNHSNIMSLIDTHLQEYNIKGLKEIIHTFKGICGNLGIVELEGLILKFEELINKNKIEAANELLFELRECMDGILNVISKIKHSRETYCEE